MALLKINVLGKMSQNLKIILSNLAGDKQELFDEVVTADELRLDGPELGFEDPAVRVKGQAYITSDMLIIQYTLSIWPLFVCKICNERFPSPMEIDKTTHAEELSNIRDGIFDLSEPVREHILLELPRFSECNDGNCPDRVEVNKYIK
ncbi:MAG: hypothetical protein S4CHLAM102_04060 [Chlamydiia bacterium]|nr:hypothetical protein [Chlamydiia bacterium]